MDVKAVQKALWCCTHPGNCSTCPYYGPNCLQSLLVDVREALTPRVLRLDEIHRGMAVWLEQYKVPEMLLVIGGSSADGQKCFITEDYSSITPYDEDYNKYWRAWTQEPTNEQREAEPWVSDT